ncbi:hypothetical protein A3J56_01215 [Candidatus Giovannonibacteria bacterium RIFCSPHIGHO2_02_FULL_46_20]|uniref:Uncharacterized protein n=1 Tax=Candidatus Giovannonibacteria bacterium RIFCSPHIGHO2_02_FULL_46_20 TaxID=1798338 RepID=A0A1F5WG36_9BACT|nr:MAG: hypothetical protein A3J56_01215 [Candidatus Giovannonibacteria bacterium RIFCSPHIGHO2_02_FULL_46_20]
MSPKKNLKLLNLAARPLNFRFLGLAFHRGLWPRNTFELLSVSCKNEWRFLPCLRGFDLIC